MYVGDRLLRGDGDEPPEPFAPVPFVWSDQYDVKIQCAGRFGGEDRMEVVHGDARRRRASSRSSSGAAGSRACSGSREPRRVMQYRRMIAERASFDAALEFAAAAAG